MNVHFSLDNVEGTSKFVGDSTAWKEPSTQTAMFGKPWVQVHLTRSHTFYRSQLPCNRVHTIKYTPVETGIKKAGNLEKNQPQQKE